MKKTIGFFFLLLLLTFRKNFAQNDKSYFISPGIKIGYTFGAGISYGITLDAGVNDNSFIRNGKYGLSFNYTFIKVKKHTHRMRTINLMAQNEIACVKLGIGRVKNPWGYSKRNKCFVHGMNLDISFSSSNIHSPWLGASYFKFRRANWAWFNNPYSTIYINYKYDVLNPTYKVAMTNTLK